MAKKKGRRSRARHTGASTGLSNAPTGVDRAPTWRQVEGLAKRVPSVRWYRARDARATRDSAETLTRVRRVLASVWKRIPLSARMVISCFDLFGGVRLWNDPDDDKKGRYRFSYVMLNMAYYDRSSEGDADLTALAAHELAHAYLNAVHTYAMRGVWQIAKKKKVDLLRRGKLRGAHYALRPEGPGTNHERMADAVVLSWGFGAELAGALDFEVLVNPETFAQSDPIRAKVYLDVVLAEFYRAVERRLDEVGVD